MYEKIDSIFIIDCRRRAVFGDGVGLLWFGPAHLQGEPAHRTVRLQNTERYCTQRRDRIANLRFRFKILSLIFFFTLHFLKLHQTFVDKSEWDIDGIFFLFEAFKHRFLSFD